MSVNFFQIHIQTNRFDEVKDFLKKWLNHTSGDIELVEENSDGEFISFFNHEIPTSFAVSAIHENWITIFHDSYKPPIDLCSRLSEKFTTTVIQAMAQSTVDTYCLSVHKEGKLVRKIYISEETLGVIQEGEPFAFEGYIEPDLYDYDDMNDFCLKMGIDLFETEESAIIIKIG